MFIKTRLWQSRYDFGAILACEHCAHEAELKTGYDDSNYHFHVIPAMLCKECGKNSGGTSEKESAIVTVEIH